MLTRRDARVVEEARLEIVCAFTRIEGSNPSLSAKVSLGGCKGPLTTNHRANPARPGREQR